MKIRADLWDTIEDDAYWSALDRDALLTHRDMLAEEAAALEARLADLRSEFAEATKGSMPRQSYLGTKNTFEAAKADLIADRRAIDTRLAWVKVRSREFHAEVASTFAPKTKTLQAAIRRHRDQTLAEGIEPGPIDLELWALLDT